VAEAAGIRHEGRPHSRRSRAVRNRLSGADVDRRAGLGRLLACYKGRICGAWREATARPGQPGQIVGGTATAHLQPYQPWRLRVPAPPGQQSRGLFRPFLDRRCALAGFVRNSTYHDRSRSTAGPSRPRRELQRQRNTDLHPFTTWKGWTSSNSRRRTPSAGHPQGDGARSTGSPLRQTAIIPSTANGSNQGQNQVPHQTARKHRPRRSVLRANSTGS
jgi:hypothetical protein